MDIGLSETQQLIRNSAREFLEENCDTQYVRAMEEDEVGHTEELWDQLAELGWLGLTVPEEYGGAGMSFSELAILLEETGAELGRWRALGHRNPPPESCYSTLRSFSRMDSISLIFSSSTFPETYQPSRHAIHGRSML